MFLRVKPLLGLSLTRGGSKSMPRRLLNSGRKSGRSVGKVVPGEGIHSTTFHKFVGCANPIKTLPGSMVGRVVVLRDFLLDLVGVNECAFAGGKRSHHPPLPPTVLTGGSGMGCRVFLSWLCVMLCTWGMAANSDPKLRSPRQTALNEWRDLTATNGLPRAFVKGNDVRMLFGHGANAVEYRGDWSKLRVPTPDFKILSAQLKLERDSHDTPALQEHWRQARVIGGVDLQRVSSVVMDDLVPRTSGHGMYYQSFLADGVLYRDTNGAVRSAELGSLPADLAIDHRYSIHETVSALAERFESELTRTHPGEGFFLLMLPEPGKYTTCLLLDLAKRRCVWLSPAGLYDRTEMGMDMAATLDSLSALVVEGHGLALIKNPFSSAARLVDFGVQTAWRFLRWPRPKAIRPGLITPGQEGMNLADWEQWLDGHTGTKVEQGTLELLIDGDRYFPRLKDAITAATNHVSVDMYIFDRDDVGVDVARQLKEKSRSIPVKVVVDRMGTWAGGVSPPATPLPVDFESPSSMQSFLKSPPAVGTRSFLNPWFSSDHNKMVIVDGWRAWLGGMNLGREYRYEWHDLMVEVRGPVVSSLEEDFRRLYAHEGLFGDLAYAIAVLAPLEHHNPGVGNWVPVRLLPTRTGWKPMNTAVLAAIGMAREHIYVENPYLFDKRVTGELVRARRRGVDVRVILPRVNDFKAGARSNLVTANYLMAHGVRVFFYPGMSHVKALQVDGWSCVGSANLNHLSLRLCRENNIASSDPEFARSVRQDLFEPDFAKSYELKENIGVDWADFLTDLVLESF